MANEEKLDEISQTLTDVRLAMATMHGEVIALVKAVDASTARSEMVHVDHETRIRDVERITTTDSSGLRDVGSRVTDAEQRLRSVERRVWALPSIGTVIAVVSLLLELYSRM